MFPHLIVPYIHDPVRKKELFHPKQKLELEKTTKQKTTNKELLFFYFSARMTYSALRHSATIV